MVGCADNNNNVRPLRDSWLHMWELFRSAGGLGLKLALNMRIKSFSNISRSIPSIPGPGIPGSPNLKHQHVDAVGRMCLRSTKQQGSSKQSNAFDSIRANLNDPGGGGHHVFPVNGPRCGESWDVIKKLYLRFMQTSRISLQHTASVSPFLPSNVDKMEFNPLSTGP